MFTVSHCSTWVVLDSTGKSLQCGLLFLGFLVLLTFRGWFEKVFTELIPGQGSQLGLAR